MAFAFTNITLVDNGVAVHPAALVVMEGRVAYAGAQAHAPDLDGTPALDAAGRGWTLIPGLIDLQINGAYGYDFTTQPESIAAVARRLPKTGVTAFLPTFVTSPLQAYPHFLAAVRSAQQAGGGARVLGAHLEGPFLHPQSCGAHDPGLFREPDPAALAAYQPLGAAALITLAAERPHGLDAVRYLRAEGRTVALGHTQATYAEARAAFETGVSYLTHIFNVMPPIDHRAPGPIGALFDAPQARCGLIADGIHVDPTVVRMLYKLLGPERITLVTDAIAALGQPPGEFVLGGKKIYVADGQACLADGRLAGSVLRLDAAVRNMVAFCGCSLAAAVQMASLTPVFVLGLEKELGRLQPGYPADLALLDPKMNVLATFIAGKPAYLSPAADEISGSLGCV